MRHSQVVDAGTSFKNLDEIDHVVGLMLPVWGTTIRTRSKVVLAMTSQARSKVFLAKPSIVLVEHGLVGRDLAVFNDALRRKWDRGYVMRGLRCALCTMTSSSVNPVLFMFTRDVTSAVPEAIHCLSAVFRGRVLSVHSHPQLQQQHQQQQQQQQQSSKPSQRKKRIYRRVTLSRRSAFSAASDCRFNT